jgi:DNA-3-methyladenine glycosylase
MLKPVTRDLFEPSARAVAPALLGLWLIRRTAADLCGGPIVETEAYLADDPACHAFGGQTARNRVMWGPPGLAYVYFIYGNHYCVNAVCRPKGIAEAVLIRAIEARLGLELMKQRRSDKALHDLTNGPGKLCAALDIDRKLDGADLCDPQSPLFIAANPDREDYLAHTGPIVATRRIGITKAADLPLRFYLQGSPFVSRKERSGA